MKERTFNPVSPVSVPFVLRVLGSFQLTHNRQVLSLPTRKIESLLAYLVLHPEAHAREKLAALFWGDMPDTHARQSLRYALAMLRKAIGGNLLIADRETVQFNPQFPIWVDAREFSDEIRGMNEDHLSVLSTPLLDQDFYRGNLLADFYDDWIFAEREQYRSHYVEALHHLVQAFRSASEYDHAIETARRVLTTDTAN